MRSLGGGVTCRRQGLPRTLGHKGRERRVESRLDQPLEDISVDSLRPDPPASTLAALGRHPPPVIYSRVSAEGGRDHSAILSKNRASTTGEGLAWTRVGAGAEPALLIQEEGPGPAPLETVWREAGGGRPGCQARQSPPGKAWRRLPGEQ